MRRSRNEPKTLMGALRGKSDHIGSGGDPMDLSEADEGDRARKAVPREDRPRGEGPGSDRSRDDLTEDETPKGDRPKVDSEIEQLRRDLSKEKDRNLRLLADFDNFRRRVAREGESARLEGRRAALLPTLPVLDALDRALAAGSTDPDFYDGVSETRDVFTSALREAGAEPIETVGRPFDPRVHEAVSTAPSEDVEPGTIVREVRPGWRLGDELLRPAQVVVATAGGEERGEPWR